MPSAAHADVPHPPSRFRRTTIAAALGLLNVAAAQAIEIDTGNPDWTLRWDNTVRYSLMTRLKDQLPSLSTTPAPQLANQNDGNNNFNKGLVSNRLDLFTELDLQGKSMGARLSAAAWYDDVYNGRTDNTSFTSNHRPASEFPSQTRKTMGRDGELLDAFVYANLELGERPASIRVGRHTLLWGESLFFGANGIAGGQAPLDIVKLTSVPNSTFKEVARPTGKVSGQIQVTPEVAVGAYVTYDWQASRIPPVGSYLSSGDPAGDGAERLLAGAPGVEFKKAPDLEAKDSGQGGLQVRFSVPSIDTDFGLYATRYHATTPSNINTQANGVPGTPSFAPSSYRFLYHEGVRAYGASFAKTVGAWGLAGEVSLRQNTPLASSGQTTLPAIRVNTGLNNNSNPGYAVGETLHAQLSWLASLGPSFISQEASFAGEVAWNQRRKVTKNEKMLNPNADKSASALRMVYSPSYRQVLPGLDLTPSIGLGYAFGKSSAVGPGFGVDKGGDISLGLAATYLGSWNFGINYVHYLGEAAPGLDAANNAQYKQALKDRNYLTLTVRTTF
jgi:Protein of unknown function (DUF1302)